MTHVIKEVSNDQVKSRAAVVAFDEIFPRSSRTILSYHVFGTVLCDWMRIGFPNIKLSPIF